MNTKIVFTNHLKCDEITVKRIFKKKRKPPKTIKEPKTVQCPICNNLFKDELILKSHIQRKHPKPKPLKCNRCYEVFKTQEELKWHSKVHAENIKCDKCEKVFKEVNDLREHYKDHSKFNDTGQEIWVCKICNVTFVSWAYRENHERKHWESSKERKMWREKFLLF